MEGHLKRCPLLKLSQSLSLQPYYKKGINAGKDGVILNGGCSDVSSEMKRASVYSLSVDEFHALICKIKSVHETICKHFEDSYNIPDACDIWIKRQIDRYFCDAPGSCIFKGIRLGMASEKVGCNLQEIAISGEACYAAGSNFGEHGKVWTVEEIGCSGTVF